MGIELDDSYAIKGKKSHNSIHFLWLFHILKKLPIVFLDLERSFPENSLDFLMIQTFFLENLRRQGLNLLFVHLDSLSCLPGALIDDLNDFFVDFGTCLLTIDVLAFSVYWGIIWEALTHTESDYH